MILGVCFLFIPYDLYGCTLLLLYFLKFFFVYTPFETLFENQFISVKNKCILLAAARRNFDPPRQYLLMAHNNSYFRCDQSTSTGLGARIFSILYFLPHFSMLESAIRFSLPVYLCTSMEQGWRIAVGVEDNRSLRKVYQYAGAGGFFNLFISAAIASLLMLLILPRETVELAAVGNTLCSLRAEDWPR